LRFPARVANIIGNERAVRCWIVFVVRDGVFGPEPDAVFIFHQDIKKQWQM
jgi:hypothetical protein